MRWDVDSSSGCWVWSGAKNNVGYGRWRKKGHTSTLAHRVSYEVHVGPIPDGLVIDHLCKNTLCVNPSHLEPVTQHENSLRGAAAQRSTCPKGHPYDAANTQRVYGRKRCAECNRINANLYYHRKRAAAVLASALLCGCVGKPTICATTWSASTGVEQSVYDGRVHPTAEVSVGGELGSDRCEETSE